MNVLELPLGFLKETCIDAFRGAETEHLVAKQLFDACVVVHVGRIHAIVQKLICHVAQQCVASGRSLVEFFQQIVESTCSVGFEARGECTDIYQVIGLDDNQLWCNRSFPIHLVRNHIEERTFSHISGRFACMVIECEIHFHTFILRKFCILGKDVVQVLAHGNESHPLALLQTGELQGRWMHLVGQMAFQLRRNGGLCEASQCFHHSLHIHSECFFVGFLLMSLHLPCSPSHHIHGMQRMLMDAAECLKAREQAIVGGMKRCNQLYAHPVQDVVELCILPFQRFCRQKNFCYFIPEVAFIHHFARALFFQYFSKAFASFTVSGTTAACFCSEKLARFIGEFSASK